MNFSQFSIADIVNCGLLLVAIIGIFLTLKQIKNANLTQKATFFKELYSDFFSDPDIRNAYYKIEYNKFKYNSKFHGSKDEIEVDRLLSFVDLICNLYIKGILSNQEMESFKYEFLRIHNNISYQSYMNILERFYELNKIKIKPFVHFQNYCLKIK